MSVQPAANLLRSLTGLFIDAGRFHYTDKALSQLPLRTRQQRLFLTSFCVLFFELACIRWAPAYVRFLGFFLNFILMAAFLGIGVGILAGRRSRLWLPPFPLALFILVAVVALSRVEISVPSTQVLYYGAGEVSPQAEHYFMLPVIFILTVLAFTPLARALGRYIASMPPLQAYAWDIAGSLAGIAAFFLMSYFSLPPVVWFGVLALALLPLLDRKALLVGTPFLLGVLAIVYWLGKDDYWSPYYRVQVHPHASGVGYSINVNNVGHQDAIPAAARETFYYRVYDLFRQHTFDRVLVIGAGSGSDVSIALQNGAQQVDAVEIDPVIYRLGVQLHPDHPYADPRVHVYINDGRAYLRNTDQQYDLIIFALPDSLTLTSAFSSLRLESFLLTKEAIQAARARLKDDGFLVLYNYYREDWLVQKLAGMVNAAFGAPPFVTTYGDWGRAAVIINGGGLQALPASLRQPYVEPAPAAAGRGVALPVVGQGLLAGDPALAMSIDDWPFVYMPHRALPIPYIVALVMVLVIAVVAVLLAAPPRILQRFNGHFFWLGVAFMLLETRSLVTFSLLFGSTWMVNSLVFFAILCSVLLAILVNARFTIHRVYWLYGLLFLMLAVNYFIPLQALLSITSPVVRYSLASLLAFLPIFLANVVFSHSFQETELSDIAFGSNLIGSMVGGLCEYLALVTGYQALLLFAIVLYGLALWRRPQAVQQSE